MPELANNNKPLWKSLLGKILKSRLCFSLAVLFVLVLQNIITTPDFFRITITNGLVSGYLPNILDQVSCLVIVTLGMTLIAAVAGGQDISVGAIMPSLPAFAALCSTARNTEAKFFITRTRWLCLSEFLAAPCAALLTASWWLF